MFCIVYFKCDIRTTTNLCPSGPEIKEELKVTIHLERSRGTAFLVHSLTNNKIENWLCRNKSNLLGSRNQRRKLHLVVCFSQYSTHILYTVRETHIRLHCCPPHLLVCKLLFFLKSNRKKCTYKRKETMADDRKGTYY